MATLLYNGRLVNEGQTGDEGGWVLTENGFISDLGNDNPPFEKADTAIDCRGSYIMPGMIDCHVHFRQPGFEQKATIYTESRAAVSGGITSYLEMPNTRPATVDLKQWEKKMKIARRDSAANYAFFIGATDKNAPSLASLDFSQIPGVKLFVGSSTGDLLVTDNEALETIFKNVRAIIAVHSEDEGILNEERKRFLEKHPSPRPEDHIELRSRHACIKSTERLIALSRKYNSRLHLCHISTAEETEMLEKGRNIEEKKITAEVAPAHLLWSREDYLRLGNLIKINPSVKEKTDREALRQSLKDGRIDMVATDHAPHLLSEKDNPDVLKAVSGAPMVQFALPMLLEFLKPEEAVLKYSHNPARIYRIDRRGFLRKGYFADITVVKPDRTSPITASEIVSKCGWSPLEGYCPRHRVLLTMVNGFIAYSQFAEVPAVVSLSLPLRFKN